MNRIKNHMQKLKQANPITDKKLDEKYEVLV